MVWCNQLVMLLASLLRTITQTPFLTLHAQEGAQQHIIQHMQSVTQPHIATTVGLVSAGGPDGDASGDAYIPSSKTQLKKTADTCLQRQIGADSVVREGAALLVIRVPDKAGCSSE